MSFAASCDWTLIRSLMLAVAAGPLCWTCERGLRASTRPTLWLALIVLPFLFPELLLSYLIASFVVGRPWRAELACDAILLLRCVPVGVLTLWISPPSSLSSAALHLAWLRCRGWRGLGAWLRCYWFGPVRRMLPAVGLMFLVNFQEFEAAAILGAVSWTDRLFTQHAYGLTLAASTPFLFRPLVIQVVVLAFVGWSLLRRDAERGWDHEVELVSPRLVRAAEVFAGAWCFVGVVLPLLLLSRELVMGWTWLVRQPQAVAHLFAEIGSAGLVGLVAGLLAWNAARWMLPSGDREAPDCGDVSAMDATFRGLTPPARKSMTSESLGLALVCLPGLCGALTVGLAVLQVSTWSALRPLSSTPVWWVLASTIWLLPRAMLLQLWWLRSTEPAALHLVHLLRESPHIAQRQQAWRRWWAWRVEPQIAAVGVLCYWAYLDLTSAGLLAPPGMASVVVRLYNFMHNGHSAALSMEATVAMCVPVIAWGTVLLTARLGRWGGR